MPLNKIAAAAGDTDREYRDRFVTYLVERKAEEYVSVRIFDAGEAFGSVGGREAGSCDMRNRI